MSEGYSSFLAEERSMLHLVVLLVWIKYFTLAVVAEVRKSYKVK